MHRAIPTHSGLGSGTQLGLAVGRGWRSCTGCGRARGAGAGGGAGRRSAIGTWTFALGGFIVEGGRRAGGGRDCALLARFVMPASWRCVVAVPAGVAGVERGSGGRGFRAVATAGGAGGGAGRPPGADAAAAGAGGSGAGRVRGRPHARSSASPARGSPRQQGGVFAPGPPRRWSAGWRNGAPRGGPELLGAAVVRAPATVRRRELAARAAGVFGPRGPGFRRGIRRGRGPGLAVRTDRVT